MRVHNVPGTSGRGDIAVNKTKFLLLWDYMLVGEAENKQINE